MAALSLLGLAIRLAPVLGRPSLQAHGDAAFYHDEANLLAGGLGWINPFDYLQSAHQHVPAASFPPLFTILLAAASLVGAKSFLAHRIWCCLIGTSAVVLGAHTGRLIAGRRAGLLAGGLIAVYPNLWMSAGLGFSETLSPAVTLAVLWASYRFWLQPRPGRAAAVGAMIGLAALARDELALLAVLIMLPLCLLARHCSRRQRLMLLVAGGVTAGAVVAPWVGYNLTRFDKPVFISDGLGVTLASANCDRTYFGQLTGYWSIDCALAVAVDPQADESVQGAQLQRAALEYARRHDGELPRVVVARVGRAFAFYRPVDQVRLDAFFEGRSWSWGLVGLGMYYPLVVLAAGGVRVLRRRGIPVFPLLAVGADVLISVVLTFGQTRYRSPFEVSLVLLAAVQIDAAWDGWAGRRAGRLPGLRTDERDGPALAAAGPAAAADPVGAVPVGGVPVGGVPAGRPVAGLQGRSP